MCTNGRWWPCVCLPSLRLVNWLRSRDIHARLVGEGGGGWPPPAIPPVTLRVYEPHHRTTVDSLLSLSLCRHSISSLVAVFCAALLPGPYHMQSLPLFLSYKRQYFYSIPHAHSQSQFVSLTQTNCCFIAFLSVRNWDDLLWMDSLEDQLWTSMVYASQSWIILTNAPKTECLKCLRQN